MRTPSRDPCLADRRAAVHNLIRLLSCLACCAEARICLTHCAESAHPVWACLTHCAQQTKSGISSYSTRHHYHHRGQNSLVHVPSISYIIYITLFFFPSKIYPTTVSKNIFILTLKGQCHEIFDHFILFLKRFDLGS